MAIPNTDLAVAPLNLGGNTFGWTSDEQESFDVLDSYIHGGGNFVDTADMYSQWAEGHSGGESETVLGKWLHERGSRDQIVLATKVGAIEDEPGLEKDTVIRNLDRSLDRLHTDRIDLYYYHYDDESVSISDQVNTAAALIDAGKIRYVGLSNYTPERMQEFFTVAAAEAPLVTPVAIQPQYSLLSRSNYEDNYRSIAGERNVAVFTYFSLASGLLTGKYRSRDDVAGAAREGMTADYFDNNADPFDVVKEVVRIADGHEAEPASVALAWLRAKGVTAPIASARTTKHMSGLLASMTLNLSADDVAALDKASAGF